MTVEEIKALLEESALALKNKAEGAEQKAADAMNKYEEVKVSLGETASKSMIDALEMKVSALQDMADTLALKIQNGGGNVNLPAKNIWADFAEQFEEKKAELERCVKERNGSIRLQIKNNVSGIGIFGDRVIFGLREPGIDRVPDRQRFIFNLIQTIQGGPGSNPLSWIEEQQVTTGEGVATEAGWVAESATKPILKWEWVERKVTAETIAAMAVVTKQAILNWPILQSELQNNLFRKLYDKLDFNIISGNGVSNSIFGIKYYAKDFNVGDIDAVTNPQNYDVLRAAIAQVRRGGAPSDIERGGFNATHILLPVDKAADMDLAKSSTDGHYLMPPFTSADGTVIKGVPVIETNFLSGDEFLVGDFSRYLFNIVEGLTVDVGYINDQFAKNQFTIRAEMYGMGRVKANEAFAFVKGNFTDAKAALLAGPAT